jgi:hypothetical protein
MEILKNENLKELNIKIQSFQFKKVKHEEVQEYLIDKVSISIFS